MEVKNMPIAPPPTPEAPAVPPANFNTLNQAAQAAAGAGNPEATEAAMKLSAGLQQAKNEQIKET